ncbi:MAG: hypothetical protein JSW66_06965 [Phycisphaerales bacterium]|nr:MAG: hypothetical protein JSW66_06965 [Phycisphaerales bacterium]
MTSELEFDHDPARINTLKIAARQASGQVYYETTYRREPGEDGSWHEVIEIDEKYSPPNPKSAALLEREGVEVVFHPCLQKA